MPEHLKRFVTGSYCPSNADPFEIYEDNDTMYLHPAHGNRTPLLYHTDNWLSYYVNGALLPGIRLSVQWIDNQKVFCVESRDDLTIHRSIYGNHFIPEDTLSDEIRACFGIYSVAGTDDPALAVYQDTLPWSGRPYIRALHLENYDVMTLKPYGTFFLIMQGIGRSGQEVMCCNNDTLSFSGWQLYKSGTIPMQRTVTFRSDNNAKTPTEIPSIHVTDYPEKMVRRIKTLY
jgi:hypothetical protein